MISTTVDITGATQTVLAAPTGSQQSWWIMSIDINTTQASSTLLLYNGSTLIAKFTSGTNGLFAEIPGLSEDGLYQLDNATAFVATSSSGTWTINFRYILKGKATQQTTQPG